VYSTVYLLPVSFLSTLASLHEFWKPSIVLSTSTRLPGLNAPEPNASFCAAA
jgi:hypothetical protein